MTIPDYADAASIKSVMPDVEWGTAYDTVLGVLATRASRLIDIATIRNPGEFAVSTAGTVKYFDGNGKLRLWIDELADVPSKVEVSETGDPNNYITWASTDYRVWPYNMPPYRCLDIDLLYGSKMIWYAFPKSVKITGPWGFSTSVPEPIKEATIIQVMRWFKRGQQGFADTGAIIELGQLRYTSKLDPDVELILEQPGYMRRFV